MIRFLVLALPLVLLALAVGHFAVEAADLVRPRGLPAPYLLGQWVLEAAGLSALFVLVRERGLGRWVAGLAGAWAGWIFRGPVLALVAAPASRLPATAWWHLVLAWLVIYTVCGLLMAAVARGLQEPTEPTEPTEPPATPAGEPSEPRAAITSDEGGAT